MVPASARALRQGCSAPRGAVRKSGNSPPPSGLNQPRPAIFLRQCHPRDSAICCHARPSPPSRRQALLPGCAMTSGIVWICSWAVPPLVPRRRTVWTRSAGRASTEGLDWLQELRNADPGFVSTTWSSFPRSRSISARALRSSPASPVQESPSSSMGSASPSVPALPPTGFGSPLHARKRRRSSRWRRTVIVLNSSRSASSPILMIPAAALRGGPWTATAAPTLS